MSVRIPFGAKVIVDTLSPTSIYCGMPTLDANHAPTRGQWIWRRAGIPSSPSSKLMCELQSVGDPKVISFTRTIVVVYDDGGQLGDAYMDAYANLASYNELARADPRDTNLRALWLDAYTTMHRAREALTKIAHP